jgi:ATP-dependent helicase HrpB
MQADPGLEGVGAVLLDEFHERSVEVDTALTLCREVQTLLRPDLRLVVMSATLGSTLTDTLTRLLEDELKRPATLVRSAGRSFPLTLKYTVRTRIEQFGKS